MIGIRAQIYHCWPETRNQPSIHIIYVSTALNCYITQHPIESIVADIRAAQRRGATKFIFHNTAEPIILSFIVKAQYVVNCMTDIDPSSFYYTTAALSGPAEYDKLADSKSWNRRMNILVAHHFEMVMRSCLHQVSPEYNIRVKGKKFVCFNRIDRPHRVLLLDWILSNDMLSDIYFSFEGITPDWLTRCYKQRMLYSNKWQSTVEHLYDNYKHLFPIRLNITPDRHNPVDVIPADLLYHDDSYFSVITETLFHTPSEATDYPVNMAIDHGVFITEKTYKGMALKHPFILLAMPGTLRALRDAGYRTFSPYIDESYDDEVSSNKRLALVKGEITRLCNFTDEEWITWQTNVKEIVEHNYTVLSTERPIGVTKFDF